MKNRGTLCHPEAHSSVPKDLLLEGSSLIQHSNYTSIATVVPEIFCPKIMIKRRLFTENYLASSLYGIAYYISEPGCQIIFREINLFFSSTMDEKCLARRWLDLCRDLRYIFVRDTAATLFILFSTAFNKIGSSVVYISFFVILRS